MSTEIRRTRSRWSLTGGASGACFHGRVDDPEQWFRRGSELADEGGAVEAEALALLSAAVAAGYGPAKVRLAEFLLHQCSTADAASRTEALQLLREAVTAGVPGARHMLGVTLWDDGALDEAENLLRAALADGELDVQMNLAGLLHHKGDDAAAFALLRQAAERGGGPAYWIVMRLLPPASRAAREVTMAYESATPPEERPVCVLLIPGAWELDPSVLPVD
ncbi:tetratricopeptide repeat protein [Dactylosporangium sp. NPDC050688]|uniref:tetratricopeptide repeat protein n=1 Tax=Dactylosporangium sp. NPDC050688 TaxID=3157217 RepID=UPI0033F386E3